MTTKPLTRWTWLDGDIGRRKVIEINGIHAVAECEPKYLGRGQYSDNWYLTLWPMDYINPNSDLNFDALTTKSIEIQTPYRTSADGNFEPIASLLDELANGIISNLKQCATCSQFFVCDSTGLQLKIGDNEFCSVNCHNMMESANED